MNFFSRFKLFFAHDSPSTRSNNSNSEIPVTAQLNHKLMPMDRGERYEDPLQVELEAAGFGTVDGGGTMQLKSGEIEYIDVELLLTDLEKSVPFVVQHLEAMGAPKGSKLIIHDSIDSSREILFGRREGLGVYLDGVNLPPEVYKNEDINVLIQIINQRLETSGGIESFWEGPTQTALYVYGESAGEILDRIQPVLIAHPLCQGSRTQVIAPLSQPWFCCTREL